MCVEARAKLNTPGKKDGLNQLWIDGRLEAERKNLDWRGSYDEHGINAVFLEAYWNKGSPVRAVPLDRQLRDLDQAHRAGRLPAESGAHQDAVPRSAKQKAWEAEVAADGDGKTVVWRSQPIAAGDRTTVDAAAGQFVGPLAGEKQLDAAAVYYCRVRQQSEAGVWSPWSAWHQPLRTAEK